MIEWNGLVVAPYSITHITYMLIRSIYLCGGDDDDHDEDDDDDVADG